VHRIPAIRIKVRIHHDIAVAENGDAVDVQILLRNVLDHVGEDGGIDTLRFGRGLAPVLSGEVTGRFSGLESTTGKRESKGQESPKGHSRTRISPP
jgi:hypothetical protein